eukprot:Hpha_TRINITY_DN5856_c0_g1::TRINITY_DN5856_c0_g1_i1::g.45552::m.45552
MGVGGGNIAAPASSLNVIGIGGSTPAPVVMQSGIGGSFSSVPLTMVQATQPQPMATAPIFNTTTTQMPFVHSPTSQMPLVVFPTNFAGAGLGQPALTQAPLQQSGVTMPFAQAPIMAYVEHTPLPLPAVFPAVQVDTAIEMPVCSAVPAEEPDVQVREDTQGSTDDHDGDPSPPPLLADAAAAGSNSAAARGSGRVVAITGLRIDADLDDLAHRAAEILGAEVVRSLGVWNKSSLVVELDHPVRLRSRNAMAQGNRPGPPVYLCRSPMDHVALPTPCRTLNVRVFVMDPKYDYEGTPAEIAAQDKIKREWTQAKPESEPYEISRVVEAVGGRSCMIVPSRPRMMSLLEPQRCYTQLLFKYTDIPTATRALNKIEGLQRVVGDMRVTLRAEFSKPVSNAHSKNKAASVVSAGLQA